MPLKGKYAACHTGIEVPAGHLHRYDVLYAGRWHYRAGSDWFRIGCIQNSME